MATVEDAIEDNLVLLSAHLAEGPHYFKKAFKHLDNEQDAELMNLINPEYRQNLSAAGRYDPFQPVNGIFTDPRAIHYNIDTSGGNQVELVRRARAGYNAAIHMYDVSPLERLGVPSGVADAMITRNKPIETTLYPDQEKALKELQEKQAKDKKTP